MPELKEWWLAAGTHSYEKFIYPDLANHFEMHEFDSNSAGTEGGPEKGNSFGKTAIFLRPPLGTGIL